MGCCNGSAHMPRVRFAAMRSQRVSNTRYARQQMGKQRRGYEVARRVGVVNVRAR